MTLQEKIEVLDGVKDHPNKEKLVFKIDDEWVPYHVLQFRTLTGIGMRNFIENPSPPLSTKMTYQEMYEDSLKERTIQLYAGEKGLNLLNDTLNTLVPEKEDYNNFIQDFVDKINSDERLRWYDPISNEMKRVEATKINQ